MKNACLILLAICQTLVLTASAENVIFDFESGDMQGWKIVEGKFEKLLTDRAEFHHKQGPYNKEGKYFLSTLELADNSPSDKATGVAESPVFRLDNAEMSLLVGGGRHHDTYVALCTLDDKQHLTASGDDAQPMKKITWKAPKELLGQKVFLRLVDGNAGGWGHITFDNFQAVGQLDEAASEAHFASRKPMLNDIPKPPAPEASQISKTGIRHSFLITGAWTAIIGEDNEIIWRTPGGSRDGCVLENGNVLIAFGNVVKEFTRDGKVVFEYKIGKGNREISTAIRLANNRTLITELGNSPRLIEVEAGGTIAVDVVLEPETNNAHMQTRMARKLPNGNYLVPHLLAFAVKEYQPDGKIVKVLKTDLEDLGGRKAENWPFTAIRLENGNTVINLTHGNKCVELDADGKVIWVATNADAGGLFKDPCGGQRLPNGNTVFVSHAEGRPDGTKVFEITRDKEVVWEYKDPRYQSGHEIHILTTNGEPVTPALR
ncbi:MAG: hypothetical protein O2857_08790 [Planctomycetota bacterium]|nr:hypothetical protein [Planctomycetota bacterium]